jgi:hypothetical protein
MTPAKSKAFLLMGGLLMIASAAQATTFRDVLCANGRKVQAVEERTDAEACRLIGSKPAESNAQPLKGGGDMTLKRSATDEQKARKYQQLAAQHKPRTAQQEKLVKEYMKLPAVQRDSFKAQNPTVQKSIWDYGPYAVCFYASVAGGADVVEAGEECHEDWVN